MEFFKKLQKHANQTGMVVCPEELDVILEMFAIVPLIGRFQIDRGTFILDGQLYGKEAECIARCNFRHGAFTQPVPRSLKDSDAIAAESIDEALAWPAQNSRYQRYFCEDFISIEVNGQQYLYPASGIYQDGELLVLILNATAGRFLASVKIDQTERCGLLYGLAELIGTLHDQDSILQHSCTDLKLYGSSELQECMEYLPTYVKYVREYLQGPVSVGPEHQVNPPAVKTWRAWRHSSAPESQPVHSSLWADTFF